MSLIEDLARRMRATLMSDDNTIRIAVLHRGLDGELAGTGSDASQMAERAAGK